MTISLVDSLFQKRIPNGPSDYSDNRTTSFVGQSSYQFSCVVLFFSHVLYSFLSLFNCKGKKRPRSKGEIRQQQKKSSQVERGNERPFWGSVVVCRRCVVQAVRSIAPDYVTTITTQQDTLIVLRVPFFSWLTISFQITHNTLRHRNIK